MNNNLLNNKRDREKETTEIIVTLAKIAQNNYKYIGDTVQDRTKFKIPLVEDKCLDMKNIQGEKNQQIKEKSNNSNSKNSNTHQINGHNNSSFNQENKPSINDIKINSNIPEEIPLLAKYVEKNLKQPIMIPSCSQWFNFDGIHDIETKALPEFFCGVFPAKTPEIYKEFRKQFSQLFQDRYVINSIFCKF